MLMCMPFGIECRKIAHTIFAIPLMNRSIAAIILLMLVALPVAAQTSGVDSSGADSQNADSSDAGFFASWDGRVRLRVGVASIRLRKESTTVFPIYFSMNYRVSTNALPPEPGDLRLGLGFEAGIFYLYPYALLGPELRVGDFYIESHGGATFIFLVGSDTPGGSGAAVGGCSVGWTFGSEEILRMELQAGADAITLLSGSRSTTWMPHATISFRF
jgi:hypothetical protein